MPSSSSSSSSSSCQVVVLGGNVAGLSISHHLLRNVLPNISADPAFSYKLTLVTPNSHALWKPGVPQALVDEGLKRLDELFLPVGEAFERYGEEVFELVRGKACAVDEEGRKITVQSMDSGDLRREVEVSYDALVIATGTESPSPLWTIHNGHDDTAQAILSLRQSLKTAKTVLIAGGGAAGVESAGFIAHHCPQGKEITLLSGSDRLLPRKIRPALAAEAEGQLAKLGVQVRHNVRVKSAKTTEKGVGFASTLLGLSDNTSREVDLYIDATGAKPNTSFAPRSWLTDMSYIDTDEKTLRVKGSNGGFVYCIGDVSSYSTHSIFESTDPVRPLGFSLWEDLKRPDARRVKAAQYHPDRREFHVVPIGGGGVGVVKGWRLPKMMVWIGKGRTYLQQLFRPLVYGDAY